MFFFCGSGKVGGGNNRLLQVEIYAPCAVLNDIITIDILSGKICDTKSRGRQRTKKNTDSQNKFVTRKESPNNEVIRRNDDRED